MRDVSALVSFIYQYLQEKPIYNAYAYYSEVPVRQINDTETEGKCYYSGRSKTLMVAIPKKFAFNADLKGGDIIRIKFDMKNKTMTIRKHE